MLFLSGGQVERGGRRCALHVRIEDMHIALEWTTDKDGLNGNRVDDAAFAVMLGAPVLVCGRI